MNLTFTAFPLFLIAILAFIAISWLRFFGKYRKIPKLHQYAQTFPDLVKNGRATCCACGSNQIYIRVYHRLHTKTLNYHVCRVCGKTLYRSTS